jgi:hypothetical protein
MSDVDALTQLVLRERQGRDRGWWTQMRECFAHDATIRLSWFEGTADEFIAGSQAMAARGDQASHRLSPPVVHVMGDRAVVELPMIVEFRTVIDGVEADLASMGRLLYRAASRDDRWRIVRMDAIYQRDTLAPSIPGTPLHVSAEDLAGFRPAYRLLAYHLSRRGYTIGSDLYGDDRRDEVEELYRATFAWARASVGAATGGRAPGAVR